MHEVQSIDALVHPDFDYYEQSKADPTTKGLLEERLLRAKWNTRTLELASQANSLLIYVPAISFDQADTPVKAKLREASRIATYSALLGDRFILFPFSQLDWAAVERDLPRTIANAGFSFGKSTKLNVYGEYYCACVHFFNDDASVALKLDGTSIRELSL